MRGESNGVRKTSNEFNENDKAVNGSKARYAAIRAWQAYKRQPHIVAIATTAPQEIAGMLAGGQLKAKRRIVPQGVHK